jgi:hypothetical protein
MIEPEYSALIGLKKALKNSLVVMGPTIIIALAKWQEWLPVSSKLVLPIGVLMGFISYMIKNYIKNK